jgi:hypothetical protein
MKLLSRALAILCLSPLLSVLGCNNSPKAAVSENHASASTAETRSRAVVFVHGIYGSGQDTWKSEDGKAYWPDLIRTDSQFRDADVVVKSYLTPFTGNHNSVQMISASLGRDLADVFATHKEIIFLCHSLGGLIVKQLLVDNPGYAQKVPFIVFYATPGTGSFVARFASVFSDDPLLEAMSNAGDNKYLLNLEDRWRTAKFQPHRYCAYEERKMRPRDLRAIVVGGTSDADQKLRDFVGGIYVVDPFSATYGCDSNTGFSGIDANHVGIVKPTSKGDASYVLFAKYYAANGVQGVVAAQPIRYDKTLCAFYGEANQGSSAWNQDEACPIPDKAKLDPDFHQGDFNCCGGGAGSSMTNASVPAGLEIKVDGGHYWSVDRGSFEGDVYKLHTYCGPEPFPGPGCNVKVKILAHYKILASQ